MEPTWRNAACRNADVILAIGTRFDDRATSAWLPGFTYNIPPSKLIHVDIDPSEIGKNFQPALGIIGDAKLFLQQLLAAHAESIDAGVVDGSSGLPPGEKGGNQPPAPTSQFRCGSDSARAGRVRFAEDYA